MGKVVLTTDDLTGEYLEPGDGGAVPFSLFHKKYEIDLSDKEQRKLAELLGPYLRAAREVVDPNAKGRAVIRTHDLIREQLGDTHVPTVADSDAVTSKPRAKGIKHSKEEVAEVRQWFRDIGGGEMGGGRLPDDVWDAFENGRDVSRLDRGRITVPMPAPRPETNGVSV
jgi:hypothetical protein